MTQTAMQRVADGILDSAHSEYRGETLADPSRIGDYAEACGVTLTDAQCEIVRRVLTAYLDRFEQQGAIPGSQDYYVHVESQLDETAGERVLVDSLADVGIHLAAQESGCVTVAKIGRYEHPAHPGSNAHAITLYDLGTTIDTCRVASTNGDPVWEEEDTGTFARLLREYGQDS